MKKMDYFEILKKAFLMTWKNKSMWFFGFLVFLGSFTTTFNNNEIPVQQKNQFLSSIQNFSQNYPVVAASLAFVLIMLLAILFILKLIATASLIKMSNNIAVYKQAKIKSIFAESREFVWRLLGMEILLGIFILAIASIILTPIAYLFSLNSKILASVFLLFGLAIIALLLALTYYLIKYGQIFLVLGNISIKTSLEKAYELLEKNIKESLLFGLISLGLNFIFLLALILSIFIIGLILALIGFLLYLVFKTAGALIILIIGSVLFLLFVLVTFSWFSAFMQSAWVLFFQQISLSKKEDEKEKEAEIEASAIMPDPEAV